ncbi:MAG: hypothetical protein NTZ09_08140 [Candidatus Hydrogenedentes bacterium]|nr:hypothetical protein [Candidatus Hydrogenedentota bacterium]
MKKVYMLGMMLMVGACFAYAASLSVPWFVDNATPPSKLPPLDAKVVGLVYLHNNLVEDVTCEIAYYSQIGHFMGPEAPDKTTFEIPALSTVAFRPGKNDPVIAGSGGQESPIALLVPNRPTVAPDDVVLEGDDKLNGSIVISWTTGGANDVQGIVLQTQNADGLVGTNPGRALQWGTLLPPGVS